MKKIWIFMTVIAVGIAAVSLLPSTTEGRKSKLRKASNPVPNKYIVVLKPEAMQARAETSDESAGRLAASYGGAVDRVYNHALQGFSAQMTEEAAEAMSSDPGVLFIEEDSFISVNTTQPNAPWGLDRVDQRTVPLNSSYSYVKTGSGVHVYVIDTGIRPTHVDFGGRASADYDSMYDGQNGVDCHGHGTHVAGTIGGTNYGIAKNVSLHGIRVLGCNGIGSVATAIEGVDWVTANHISPAVANMSMGSNASPLMDYAVQGSINAGVTYVVAAGNSNADACQYSPGRVSSAITVGAADQTDTKAGFSNHGSCVDLFAPGVGITSAWAWSDVATNSSNGTSMAAPHVTGTVALFMEDNQSATPAEATSALMDSATSAPIAGAPSGSPNLMLFTAPNGPTAGDAIVSGQVIDDRGRAIKNLRIVLQNGEGGEPVFALTNAFGYYVFQDVPVGGFYTLSIQSKRFNFENNPFSFTLGEDFTGMTFVGTPRR